ncbi:MAG TPA: shikimate kinase [Candidatus Cloacimonadota bacterium]|jgi:shikimate kinase|nr:shikimate kinase [Candidatus Cloacimonadales bacterium]HPY95697.1 shikimate kinase [Candidatus Cloacimonadota bacterium]HQB40369.1 shikimate kinase [Candidatus Cloacimonadota bacterium]
MNNQFILIGFMGAGKSYLGSRLSYLFNYNLVDIDLEIEKDEGIRIPTIFANYGEDYFRTKESELFKYFIQKNQTIISCGGGLTENIENRRIIKASNSIVIFLDPEWDIIWERIKSSDRPFVRGKNKSDVYQLWEKRIPNYLDCATVRFQNQNTIDKLLEQLVDCHDAVQFINYLLQ